MAAGCAKVLGRSQVSGSSSISVGPGLAGTSEHWTRAGKVSQDRGHSFYWYRAHRWEVAALKALPVGDPTI